MKPLREPPSARKTVLVVFLAAFAPFGLALVPAVRATFPGWTWLLVPWFVAWLALWSLRGMSPLAMLRAVGALRSPHRGALLLVSMVAVGALTRSPLGLLDSVEVEAVIASPIELALVGVAPVLWSGAFALFHGVFLRELVHVARWPWWIPAALPTCALLLATFVRWNGDLPSLVVGLALALHFFASCWVYLRWKGDLWASLAVPGSFLMGMFFAFPHSVPRNFRDLEPSTDPSGIPSGPDPDYSIDPDALGIASIVLCCAGLVVPWLAVQGWRRLAGDGAR